MQPRRHWNEKKYITASRGPALTRCRNFALGLGRPNSNNSPMPKPAPARPSFAPGNWPGWLAAAFLWLLARTPYRLGHALAVPLGGLMSVAMKSRRRVVERNLERCFPELDATQRRALRKATFTSLGRTVFETAWSWSPSRRLDRQGQVEGFENLSAISAQGRGVLVLTLHSTCLEIGAWFFGGELMRHRIESAGIYRPLRSAVLEWYQNRGRSRYADDMISKRDLRSAIRLLRRGGAVWYAPDQDFGPRESEFAPFFNIPTASLLATRKLAQLTGCAVVPMFPYYDPGQRRYRVEVWPALDQFPGEDAVQDLTRINQLTETMIRSQPGQYWWVHRRFKTRPPGEPPFYS